MKYTTFFQFFHLALSIKDAIFFSYSILPYR